MPKNKTLKEIVGENVKALRKAKGLSQADVASLAKKAGTPINQTTVGRAERGDDPSVDPASIYTLEALANGLGVAPWQLSVAGLDPKNLPIAMTQQERETLERLLQRLPQTVEPSHEFQRRKTDPLFQGGDDMPGHSAKNRRKVVR